MENVDMKIFLSMSENDSNSSDSENEDISLISKFKRALV